MGIAEQARAAFRPANRIEAVAPATPFPASDKAPPSTAPPTVPSKAPATPLTFMLSLLFRHRPDNADKEPAYLTEPESIRKNYYVEEKGQERYYYDDYRRGALAFRASGTAVISRREDLNTVRAMLDVAQARHWDTLALRGSEEFRREAWIEAATRGLHARGYAASDSDRQEVDRRRAERMPVNKPPLRVVSNRNPQARPPEKEVPPSIAESHQRLSPDGRLVVAALSEKIDRQMKHHTTQVRNELKAFVVDALMSKEYKEGPVVLSAAQRQTVSGQELKPAASTPASAGRRLEPQAPHRTLSR